MRNHFRKAAAGCVFAIVCLTCVASAQAPAPAGQAAPAAAGSNVVANPTYISIPLEITVNRPAAEVWNRVGKFCDIENMKILAEGGTLPPAPPRAGGQPEGNRGR